MQKSTLRLSIGTPALVGWFLFSAAGYPQEAVEIPVTEKTPTATFYEDYDSVLKQFVSEDAFVDYESLKKNRGALNRFAGQLAKVSEKEIEKWSEEAQIAFWINSYNALTLAAIVDHYPIEASLFRSLLYPSNSIRQIDGVWDELLFVVAGRTLTLDDIEHQILRQAFDEPRIHMALVCAARSCPPLRREPYTSSQLDLQLSDQSKKFLTDSGKFRIERSGEETVVHLSSIFDWFGDDFAPIYLPESGFSGHPEAARAVLNFISTHLSERERLLLKNGKYRVRYYKYDWSLNEK
jgi:hypothetical protein